MSRTDKTNPYWVKLEQEPSSRVEHHDHRRGVCDIDEYDPKHNQYISYWHNHCHYKLRYVNMYWFFNVKPGVKHIRPYHVRTERAKMRNKLADWKKSTLEDIYDDEFGNYQHRHSAQWEAW